MSKWKTYKLGDLIEVQNGYAFKAVDFSDNGIPVIKIKNIVPPRIVFDDCEYYSKKLDKRLEQFLINKGNILISLTGSHINQIASAVGKVGKYHFDYPALLNQRVGKLFSKNENLLNQDYFYYYISRFETQVDLAPSAAGSANQANISPTQIKNLKIRIPPLPTQRRIAQILTSLDDKIELNLQMNQTLEAMAQAVFKEWFVEFNFPEFDGELVDGLPKGWRRDKLSSICTVKYGKDHKHLEDGNIPVYGSGGIMRYAEKALYEDESILIPRKGTLSNLFYVTEPFWSVDTMFYTIINESQIRKYLFYFLKTLNLASMNVGSAVPSLTTKVLNKIDVIIPDKKSLQKFESIISAFYLKIDENNNQIRTLTQTRDALLPKLISGSLNLDLLDE